MPATDNFSSNSAGLSSPIVGGFAITPHATTEIAQVTRGLMVTVAGDVAVTTVDGSAITLPGLVPGVIYPIRVKIVKVSGTTATGIIGLV